MRHRLQVAQSLSLSDWWAFAQAWLLLLVVDLALRRLPMPRIQNMLAPGWRAQPGAHDATASATVDRLHNGVEMAARHHLYTMSCLRTALTLQALLRWHGIETELRIGVRRNRDGLAAHAWLEHGGQPIGQPGDVATSFRPLAPSHPEI